MGMRLENKSGNSIRWGHESWARLLSLAEMYGWEPSGTTEPHGEPLDDWVGGYNSNDGQYVSPEDAKAMGDALGKALDDIPDSGGNDKTMTYSQGEVTGVPSVDLLISVLGPGIIGPNYKLSLFEFFAGEDNLEGLREFIQFCKQDGFFID